MMSYTNNELIELENFYRAQLLNDTIPFWFPRSVDREYGGYLLMRDGDGSLIDDDKAVWIQGRAAWLLATLYHTVEPRNEWLEGAPGFAVIAAPLCDNPNFTKITRAIDPAFGKGKQIVIWCPDDGRYPKAFIALRA
jgi:hypothetical protein